MCGPGFLGHFSVKSRQAEDPMARQKQALFEALGADPEARVADLSFGVFTALQAKVLQGFWHEVRPLRAQPGPHLGHTWRLGFEPLLQVPGHGSQTSLSAHEEGGPPARGCPGARSRNEPGEERIYPLARGWAHSCGPRSLEGRAQGTLGGPEDFAKAESKYL